MKSTYKILIAVLVSVLFSSHAYSQDSTSLYKVNLRRDSEKELIIYDTLLSPDYLVRESKNYKGVSNFEFFYGFNYPKLKAENMSKNELLLSNDSIRIRITTKEFDSLKMAENLARDSNYYQTHPFYGIDEIDLNKIHLKPKTELHSISISISNVAIDLPSENFENFFNPNILCKGGHCSTSAYLTEKGEIIVQMDNGDGAGFYYAIFIFNRKGDLINRIVKGVI